MHEHKKRHRKVQRNPWTIPSVFSKARTAKEADNRSRFANVENRGLHAATQCCVIKVTTKVVFGDCREYIGPL